MDDAEGRRVLWQVGEALKDRRTAACMAQNAGADEGRFKPFEHWASDESIKGSRRMREQLRMLWATL